jgi:hypothetical protein
LAECAIKRKRKEAGEKNSERKKQKTRIQSSELPVKTYNVYWE